MNRFELYYSTTIEKEVEEMKKETGYFLKGFFGGLTAYELMKFIVYLTGCLFGYKGTYSVADCIVLAGCFLSFLFLIFRKEPERGEEME